MKIILQPGQVLSLDTVAVSGRGFAANASVKVELRTPTGRSVLSHRAATNGAGAFATVLLAPNVKDRTDCTIVVTDPAARTPSTAKLRVGPR